MTQSARPILVYVDAGADPFCADCLLRACRAVHGASEPIDATGLLAGGWQETCAALAFPGGADRPYAEKLNGRCNAMIRDYVEGGGRFLGLCAGAYYACRRIDFTGAELAVKADRELALFPGTAVGSLPELAEPYRVQDLRCAAAVDLATPDGPVTSLYWGGCRFEADGDADFDVLARYAALTPERNIAAVRVAVGTGAAVLAGVHAEVAATDFDRHRAGYAPPPDVGRLDRDIGRLARAEAARQRFMAGLLASLDIGDT